MVRRLMLALVVASVAPLVVAATASAQGTTLQVNPKVVRPGDLVTVTGGSFSSSVGSSRVSIRLNTRDGRILLAAANTNTRGQLEDAQFPMPLVSPGVYLVLGTQTTARGRQVGGTPGRTTIRVEGAAAGAAIPPAGDRGGPPAAFPAILALLLLATGSALARKLWILHRPARQLADAR